MDVLGPAAEGKTPERRKDPPGGSPGGSISEGRRRAAARRHAGRRILSASEGCPQDVRGMSSDKGGTRPQRTPDGRKNSRRSSGFYLWIFELLERAQRRICSFLEGKEAAGMRNGADEALRIRRTSRASDRPEALENGRFSASPSCRDPVVLGADPARNCPQDVRRTASGRPKNVRSQSKSRLRAEKE